VSCFFQGLTMGLAYVAPYWTAKSICDKFSADSVTLQGVSDSADCFLHIIGLVV